MRTLFFASLAILGGCTTYDYSPASSYPVDQAPTIKGAPRKDPVRMRTHDVRGSGIRPQTRLRLSEDKVREEGIPPGVRLRPSGPEEFGVQ